MKEHRRSRRILASVPLEIKSDRGSHNALSAVINLNGALILCPISLPADSSLLIRNRETGLEIGGRVVWCGPQATAGSHKLGIEFEAASADFWGAHYNAYAEEAP